jgi:hypothetical protein
VSVLKGQITAGGRYGRTSESRRVFVAIGGIVLALTRHRRQLVHGCVDERLRKTACGFAAGMLPRSYRMQPNSTELAGRARAKDP